MAAFGGLQNSVRYGKLITASFPLCNMALYPPPPIEDFHVGTIFQESENGPVVDPGFKMTAHDWNEWVQPVKYDLLPILSNVSYIGDITITNGQQIDLHHFGIPAYYMPGPQDRQLRRFYAKRGEESAILLACPSSAYRWQLKPGYLDSEWWESVKDYNFGQRRLKSFCIITDVWTTNRWALDYRPPGLPDDIDGHYAVAYDYTSDNTTLNPAPQFAFRAFSSSGNVQLSLQDRAYTVMASKIKVQRHWLGWAGHWSQALKTACTSRCTRVRRRLNGSYPLTPNPKYTRQDYIDAQDAAIIDTVSRTHLQGTLYLLEITPENGGYSQFELESQGAPEVGFCLDSFIQQLRNYASGSGFRKDALGIVFRPPQIPVSPSQPGYTNSVFSGYPPSARYNQITFPIAPGPIQSTSYPGQVGGGGYFPGAPGGPFPESVQVSTPAMFQPQGFLTIPRYHMSPQTPTASQDSHQPYAHNLQIAYSQIPLGQNAGNQTAPTYAGESITNVTPYPFAYPS